MRGWEDMRDAGVLGVVRGRSRRGLAGVLVLVASAAGLLSACDPMPPNFCPAIPGLQTWTWNGTAADQVTDSSKWLTTGPTGDGFPGGRLSLGPGGSAEDDYVCVKPNTTMTIRAGQSMHLQVLDSGGTVNLETGSKVELRAHPSANQSFVRHVSMRGEWFGRGVVTIRTGGIFRWTSTLSGAATMTTREVNVIPPGGGMPATPGRTIVSAGAKLIVDDRGVNLYDGRIIDNLGTVEVTGPSAYIAADRGTTFNNVGTLDFIGDGDYAEGFSRGIASKSQVVNQGLIRKTAGTGTSVIDAAYSVSGAGSGEVSTGVLSIMSTDALAAVIPSVSVAPRFATGGDCAVQNACANPIVTAFGPQLTSLVLPIGTATSTVRIVEVPDPALGNAIDLFVPTETASSAGTSPGPMILRMALDTSQAAGKTAVTMNITHDDVAVPDCTGGVQAECVDRAASTTVGGDVTMVIRTGSNGRWKML